MTPDQRAAFERRRRAKKIATLILLIGMVGVMLVFTDLRVRGLYARIDAAKAREGEGDLSLSYWRKVHREVFCEMLAEAGLPFQPAMPVLCEEFEKVYPK